MLRGMSPWVALSGILLFAGASFFFALAETALFALGKWQARTLREQSPARGEIILKLLERPQDLLANLALGNTVANAVMVAMGVWMALHEGWPLALTLGILFALILIVCEAAPKTLAVRSPERWALRVARAMQWVEGFTRPVHRLAQRLNETLLRLLVPRSLKAPGRVTDEEYQELLEWAFQRGTLAESEKEIMLQIIRLDRRAARDVMRPRATMACIPDDLAVPEMIAAARGFGHRRLPLYDENPDTIVGVLDTQALLLDPQVDLSEVIEFPSFVPESMNLLQLFKSLQRQKRGLAIVLDEFGITSGIVRMEDILEAVVGRMRDEDAADTFVMERLGPGRWRVSGMMRLDDFRREYPALNDVPEIETMGGLLVSRLELVPAVGESTVVGKLRLTARVADERRVRELLVETT
ncbi:MAG TPA: hemolysin family protein [Verrucomicrobiae bacterium]|nr:hemolysin family protein [Verrucomicrobiae bacterium]